MSKFGAFSKIYNNAEKTTSLFSTSIPQFNNFTPNPGPASTFELNVSSPKSETGSMFEIDNASNFASKLGPARSKPGGSFTTFGPSLEADGICLNNKASHEKCGLEWTGYQDVHKCETCKIVIGYFEPGDTYEREHVFHSSGKCATTIALLGASKVFYLLGLERYRKHKIAHPSKIFAEQRHDAPHAKDGYFIHDQRELCFMCGEAYPIHSDQCKNDIKFFYEDVSETYTTKSYSRGRFIHMLF
ncbi:hypothetical protein [Salmonella enterica]|uniref:hypothetical protein n=1 Tax=Salmonella enterica TaxID=28901 RepID=UPI0011BE6B5F|nr:hypothetical protein [Salmonella enterica]